MERYSRHILLNEVGQKGQEKISEEDFFKVRKETIEQEPSDFYSNLTVPGGTNYHPLESLLAGTSFLICSSLAATTLFLRS